MPLFTCFGIKNEPANSCVLWKIYKCYLKLLIDVMLINVKSQINSILNRWISYSSLFFYALTYLACREDALILHIASQEFILERTSCLCLSWEFWKKITWSCVEQLLSLSQVLERKEGRPLVKGRALPGSCSEPTGSVLAHPRLPPAMQHHGIIGDMRDWGGFSAKYRARK